MSLFTSIRGACVILAAAALASCADTTEPREMLQVSIAVSSAEIHPGANVDLTVTASNRGTRPVTVNASSCPAPFVVTTTAGEVVAPGGQLCALIAYSKELVPGEQIVMRSQWDGHTQRGQPGDSPVFLDPGEYRILGQVMADYALVESAPVTVQITP